MTRINVVDPAELDGRHLVAEYKELPRVFNLVRKAIERGEKPGQNAPSEYTLGTGHVRFFYDKLGFLQERQNALVEQMQARGYNPQYTQPLGAKFGDIPAEWWGNWTPSKEAVEINQARIDERLADMNKK